MNKLPGPNAGAEHLRLEQYSGLPQPAARAVNVTKEMVARAQAEHHKRMGDKRAWLSDEDMRGVLQAAIDVVNGRVP